MSAAEKSLREELEAAMKPEPVETLETAGTVDAAAETTTQERPRDEKGRFAPKGVEPSSEAAGKDEGAATGGVRTAVADKPGEAERPLEGQAAAPTEKQEVSLAPPNGWPAEAKAKWHELPPEIMQAVQKREQDIAKFTSTRDEHASFGKEMYQAVQPYMAVIKAEGGTPTSAVQSLLNTAYVLRTGSPEQKRSLLIQTARQFGVDLGAPAEAPQNTTGLPPDVQATLAEIRNYQAQIAQQQQSERQRLQYEVQQEIEAFAADPKHAHYAEVKAHMAALLGQGAAKDLQDAYDQACWASPTVRATLQAQTRAEEEQKRRAEAKAKAEEAKRKSISVTGGPGNTAQASAPEGRSIRDELRAAMAASSGAV